MCHAESLRIIRKLVTVRQNHLCKNDRLAFAMVESRRGIVKSVRDLEGKSWPGDPAWPRLRAEKRSVELQQALGPFELDGSDACLVAILDLMENRLVKMTADCLELARCGEGRAAVFF